MKIPTWFVIGCGLLVLNLVLVLGGSLSRHALAGTPDEKLKTSNQQPATDTTNLPEPGLLPPVLPNGTIGVLPAVPSLESASPLQPSIVSLEEVRNAVGELTSQTDMLAPLDAIMKDSAAPISEQLSHSYFESMKLRLKTINHLNHSAMGLVDEAAILYQRGEIAEAQKLLGVATQLREATARLLVTHQ